MSEWNLRGKKEKLELRLRQGSFFEYKRMWNSNSEKLREERTAVCLVGTVPVQN